MLPRENYSKRIKCCHEEIRQREDKVLPRREKEKIKKKEKHRQEEDIYRQQEKKQCNGKI